MVPEESVRVEPQHIPLAFELNGKEVNVAVEPHITLFQFLRERQGLNGAKNSCDMQVCGACTVLVNGKVISSCTFLAFEVRNTSVLTIEGLVEGDQLHPIMQAFIDNAGLQCGYCTSGMILATKALLDEKPHPSVDEIKEYMEGNICRCTGYKKIVESIQDAATR